MKKAINKTVKLSVCMLMVITLIFSSMSVALAASVKKPTLSSASASSSTSAVIKWKKVSGVSGYAVYRKTANSNYKKVATIKGSSKTSYTNKDLTSATKYYYKVRAFKTGSTKTSYSDYSNTKLAYTKPLTPKGLSASAKSTSSIKLSWGKVSRAKGYIIYRKSGSTYKKIATVNSTSCTVTGLKSGTKYYFRVKAYYKPSSDKSVTSSYSSTVSATTKKASTSSTQNTATGVYKTPTGKRYHFDKDCGGPNSTATTLSEAKSRGLTPCQKCAQ